mmetsp:Transcript_15363/g.22252  ORF Transcript_15363/g.22252 Transcript_15363/m.22252 type:complete len:83 (-) Transcript_15363:138-386(-)
MKDEQHQLVPSTENCFFKQDINDDDGDLVALDTESTQIEANDHTLDTYDQYLGAQLPLPKGDERIPVQVTKRMRDTTGKPIE